MRGLDEWLEAPYTDAAKREADFEAWCEANRVDPEGLTAWDEFEEFLADQQEPDPDPIWDEE